MRIKIIPCDKKIKGYVFESSGYSDTQLRRYGINEYGTYTYEIIKEGIIIPRTTEKKKLEFLLNIAKEVCPSGTNTVYVEKYEISL